MKKIVAIIAALVLAACGPAPSTNKAAAITPAPAPAVALSAPAAPVPVAADTVQVTKADMKAMLDAARLDTAQQIGEAVKKTEADKAAADKAAAEKAAAEKAAATRRAAERRSAVMAAQAKAAEPVYADVTRRVCEQKPVTVQVEVPDAVKPQEHNPAGVLIGGALGALAGHQIGNGTGQTVATIAGAAGGAIAGDAIANRGDAPKPGTHMENRTTTTEVCHDVTDHIRVK